MASSSPSLPSRMMSMIQPSKSKTKTLQYKRAPYVMFREDVAAMSSFAATLSSLPEPSEEEKAALQAGRRTLALYESAPRKPYRAGRLHKALGIKSEVTMKGGMEVLFGSTCDLHTTPELAAANFMERMQNWAQQQVLEDADIESETSILVSPRTNLNRLRVSTPFPIQSREAVSIGVVDKLEGGGFMVAYQTTENHNDVFPPSPDWLRLDLVRAAVLAPTSTGHTRLRVVSRLHLKTSVPMKVNNSITYPILADSPRAVAAYFLSTRPSDQVTPQDARQIAANLVHLVFPKRRSSEKLEAGVKLFVSKTECLAVLAEEAPWLHVLLQKAIRNRARPPKSVHRSIESMTEHDAARVGMGLASMLLSNASSQAAVSEWILKYPVLRELELESPWARPFFEGLAAGVLERATLGLKVRAYGQAALSFCDAISDLVVTGIYLGEGRTGYAFGMMGMILLTLLLQGAIIVVQNIGRKGSRGTILREFVYLFLFVKPGVDAHRVAAGKEKDAGAAMDPLNEMVSCRIIELFTEAIPGLILQAVACMGQEESRSRYTILSLVLSAASAGLICTSATYDVDTAPESRKVSPHLYGFIPDLARTSAFIIILVIHFLQLLGKSFATALVVATSVRWLVLFTVADVAVYLLYKVATRDFIYYVPIPGAALYYMFSLITNQSSVIVAAYMYNTYAEDEEKIDSGVVWAVAGGVVGLWAVLYAVLFGFVMVPKHRKTFWDGKAGWRNTQGYFLDSQDDQIRVKIFDNNRMQWAELDGEIGAWLEDKWDEWNADEPEWFNDAIRESIPDDLLPRRARGTARKKRGSASKSIMDAIVRRPSQISAVSGGGGGWVGGTGGVGWSEGGDSGSGGARSGSGRGKSARALLGLIGDSFKRAKGAEGAKIAPAGDGGDV
ncbi:hypothetical protein TeGR_g9198 [Tetraparma gracilis]|uniref:Uncharacterized protein n=1 Tax=Tetraparma gracilis TaxID=2962635 RepID=A0ABQ6NA93_9STRA|nr:hypothetical protein TeGR_g9198 [Tetraparma gracilis]